MKKLINILFTLLLAVVATSCLENGLEELDTYTDYHERGNLLALLRNRRDSGQW